MDRVGGPIRHARGCRRLTVSGVKKPPSDATRLIRAGALPAKLSKTVGPPIQKGSTVLLPDAASLYDAKQTTYGRGGLAVSNEPRGRSKRGALE